MYHNPFDVVRCTDACSATDISDNTEKLSRERNHFQLLCSMTTNEAMTQMTHSLLVESIGAVQPQLPHSAVMAMVVTWTKHIMVPCTSVCTLTNKGCYRSPISRDVPDLCHAVPRPGKTSPGTPNVPYFEVQSK